MENITLGIDESGKALELPVDRLFKERLLIQGISGSWKSSTVDYVMKQLMLNYKPEGKTVPQIILDWEGERVETFPNFGSYIVLARDMDDGTHLTIENAYHWGEISRQKKLSIIIDLSSFKTIEERETIVSEFISAMLDVEKQYWTQCIVMIDEGHNLCKQSGRCESKDAIIRLCETGRKRGLATIMVTQRLAQLNKNASAQFANRIIGKTVEVPDRKSACEMLGFSPTRGIELAELESGEFFVFGTSISNEAVKMKAIEQTEEELEGFTTIPKEKLETIKEYTNALALEIPQPQLAKILVAIEELSGRIEDSELVGYSKAMHLIRNKLQINKANAGLFKHAKELFFEEKIIRGITVLDLSEDTE